MSDPVEDGEEPPVLECMLDLARGICDEIEAWRPDLVVALYHSGQAPLRAAQALWGETRQAPFPPVVRTNLGREKIGRYDALRREMKWHRLVAWVDSAWELAHCLAWLHEQDTWREELRGQVADALGEGVAPARVLVIDDFWDEGTTWVFALGLLHSLFPAAESRYLSGRLDGWPGTLGGMWLEQYHPGVCDALNAQNAAARQQKIWVTCNTYFARMVTGTEDVDPESLAWRPMTAESEAARQLSGFLPPAAWLELAPWIYGEIEAYVQQRAGELPRAPERARAPECPVQSADLRPGVDRQQLYPAHLVLTQAWRGQPITRGSVAVLCRLTPPQSTRLLARLVRRKNLLRHGRGRGTRYTLHPEEERPADPALPTQEAEGGGE